MVNSDEIVNILREEIGSGRLLPGERLVEVPLCKRFGVKRGTVRKVLLQLEHELFVKITPNVGAEVRAITQKDVEQVYDLMGVLEGLSLRVGAPPLLDEDLEKIESLVLKMEDTSDPAAFFRLNHDFHKLLASLSDNSYLDSFMVILRARALRLGIQGMHNPIQRKWSIQEHRKILDAIKERNGKKAEKLMRDHFLKSKKRLIQYINKSL